MIINVMNVATWYFNRNWRIQDLMNSGVIPVHAHTSLERMRISLLMIVAFSFGASVGLFIEYLFEIDQVQHTEVSKHCFIWLLLLLSCHII
ncbi:hypothetical protein P3L10_020442 [Capsicum annuum]